MYHIVSEGYFVLFTRILLFCFVLIFKFKLDKNKSN